MSYFGLRVNMLPLSPSFPSPTLPLPYPSSGFTFLFGRVCIRAIRLCVIYMHLLLYCENLNKYLKKYIFLTAVAVIVDVFAQQLPAVQIPANVRGKEQQQMRRM